MSTSAGATSLAVAGALALAACESPPLATCADSLTGVWRGDARAPSGEPFAFHVTDDGAAVAIYPMYDGAATPEGKHGPIIHAPPVFALTRIGGTVVGTRAQRLTSGGRACTISGQAAVRDCRGDAVTLAWVPVASGPEPDLLLDWDACRALGAPRFTRVRLRRVWP